MSLTAGSVLEGRCRVVADRILVLEGHILVLDGRFLVLEGGLLVPEGRFPVLEGHFLPQFNFRRDASFAFALITPRRMRS